MRAEVYLSNYVHVTMGMFYRSTKPVLAPVLMAAAFYMAALFEDSSGTAERAGLRKWLAAAIVSNAAHWPVYRDRWPSAGGPFRLSAA